MAKYAQRVAKVLSIVLALNAAVAIGKLVAGSMADSISVTGDGLHSLMDAMANLVGLVVLRIATAPPDEDHPFGHSKHETLAAFVISGLLVLTAFELAQTSLGRLLKDTRPTITAFTLGMLLVTLVVNVFVARYERRAGKELGSDFLLADAAQTHGDVWVTLSILAGLGLDRAGVPFVDPLLGLGVAAVIAYVAYGVFKEAAPVLTDRALYEPSEVAALVERVPGVLSVHDIRSRGTARESYVQMHLVVDTDDVTAAHDISDEVERRLEDQLGVKEVIIHVEPYDDGSGPPGTSGSPA